MSTHSVLGVSFPDGKIVACYVHYDGSTMKPRIEDFVNKNTTTGLTMVIRKGQASGGIRGFHSPKWPSEDPDDAETDYLNDFSGEYPIDEKTFYDDHAGTYAWYLVKYETGEIEVTWKDGCEPERGAW